MRAELPLPPHSQDGFLNWQRRVQPAIHVAAVGLVQPEHQRAALGIGFRLEWEGDGGWGQGRSSPGTAPPRPTLRLTFLTVSSTTAGEDTVKALQADTGARPGVGSANRGKLRL